MKRTENEGNYLYICDHIKTGMMILIIVYHSIALWLPEGWFNQAPAEANIVFKYMAQWLNMIHIYVFVFISGYIYSYSRFKLGKYSSFREFSEKKIKRLLVPYVMVSLIWCIPMYIFFYKPSMDILIKNFVFGFAPSQLWYLLMLFWLFIFIYFPSSFFYGLDIKIMTVICLGIYILYIAISNYVLLPFQILTAVKFMPFFIIGMNLDKCFSWNGKRGIVYICFILNIILFSIYCVLPDTHLIFKIGKKILTYFVSLSGIFFVICLYNKINNSTGVWTSKIYSFLETNSFTLYLFHQQIIWTVIYKFNGKVSAIHLALLNFILSLGITSIIAWIISSRKVLHFLVGK